MEYAGYKPVSESVETVLVFDETLDSTQVRQIVKSWMESKDSLFQANVSSSYENWYDVDYPMTTITISE